LTSGGELNPKDQGKLRVIKVKFAETKPPSRARP